MSDETVRILQYLVLLNGFILAVQSIRVIATYSAVYSLTKGPKRQLPLHVWLIATSYLIYALSTSFFLVVGGQQNALGRVIFYGTAGLIGQYALWHVLSYERRRYSTVTNFQDPGDCA